MSTLLPTVTALAALALTLTPACAQPADPAPHRHDVVWTTPSADANGSMPLGNGDITLNAWVEPTGDLCFYIGKSDSWDEHGRLLKVGKIRITLDPPLPTAPFEQRLDLANGAMVVRAGAGDRACELRLWVDANRPAVRVNIESATDRAATAAIEPWRTTRQAIPRADTSDTFEDRSKPDGLRREVFIDPDVLLDDPGPDTAIGWYRAAAEPSVYDELIKVQGLEQAFEGRPDPLLHRVFGAVVTSGLAARLDATHLRSPPMPRHTFNINVRTEHPATPAQWLDRIRTQINADKSMRASSAWQAHTEWWHEFWRRSWIELSPTDNRPPPIVPTNDLPVRIGVDQHGANPFVGEIGRVTIIPRAATPTECKRWATASRDDPAAPAAPADHADPATRPLYAGAGLPGAPLEHSHAWTFDAGLTIETWVNPGALPPGGGRIADKTTPGASDGWLLDTYPANSLRLIVGPAILRADNILPQGEWSHVAATADPATGRLSLYLNGEPIAATTLDTTDDATAVGRAYALQRYITACAGRGRYPIKFNGSTLTVPADGQWGDADYRRWGPGYWWQNTRLPYLAMCAAGDSEMLEPLFRMYADDLTPINLHRTHQYTGHAGLFIPECIYFWGGAFPESYGWTPYADRAEDKLQESPWHKREWVCALELAWMMLDAYDHTQDEALARDRLIPFATEALRFFLEQYPTGPGGTLVMHPSQALETWWDTTNPMPEVAGLHAVAARLLGLPDTLGSPEQRALWQLAADRAPPLPTRTLNGAEMLAPAARFDNKSNIENPELYAVFPFRLVSFEKASAPLGIAALDHRWDQGHSGWRQDDLFMTHLGLADQARANLVARARARHDASRFPAFWGPNYDWVPDQDHGGVLMRTLQTMLMQTEGRTIYLLPAWPADWNARFKLHAPYNTTLTGEIVGGRIENLRVDPPERTRDVLIVGE